MNLQYVGLNEINGPLVVLDGVEGASYDEVVDIRLNDGSARIGRVVEISGYKAVLQVFEGTNGLSLKNTRTRFMGRPMEMPLSPEILGRVFNGAGRPVDGLGDIYAEKTADINGKPLNPVSRSYPRNYIHTGISSIDALMTLIRGQKLPIFSGSGLSHNKLAVQIVRQAEIAEESGQEFAVVFAAMGGEYSAEFIALDIILIIISIICLVFQLIPLICGGFGKLARWLLSPVKIKYRFSKVALEWYELAVTSDGENKKIKRVAKKYYDEIGVCLDNYLIPALGKKYVSAIKPAQILSVVDDALEEDRPLAEGILKNVFSYATESGYVTFDPCRDLQFEGSIEEEEKPKKTVKSRLFGMGKKIGMSLLDKYIEKSSEPQDE